MNLLAFVALLLAAGLLWWVVHRSARLRREAQNREAKMLDALLAARRSGGAVAEVDVDVVLGDGRSHRAAQPADELLRAARVQSEIVAMLDQARAARPATATPAAESTAGGGARDGEATQAVAVIPGGAAPAAQMRTPEPVVQVRDLVQVFYEARGFRAVPADASAQPIELVLTHKSDPRRSYAFAPLAGALSENVLRLIIQRARAIDQLRVLIVAEQEISPEAAAALPAQGVRAFDRAAMEAQLAKLDAGLVARIRSAAQRRAEQRQSAER